jgi:hypothetical protein
MMMRKAALTFLIAAFTIYLVTCESGLDIRGKLIKEKVCDPKVNLTDEALTEFNKCESMSKIVVSNVLCCTA